MRIVLCIALLCLTAAGGCFTVAEKSEPHPYNGRPGIRADFVHSPEAHQQDVVIGLSRFGCGFGTCPDYDVVVYGNGTVIYNGIWHVRQQGVIRTSIPKSEVQALVDAFKDEAFFDLADTLLILARIEHAALIDYISELPDSTRELYLSSAEMYKPDSTHSIRPSDCQQYWRHAPTTRLTFRSGGRQRKVSRDYGCLNHTGSEQLSRLESAIDSLTQVKRWVGDAEWGMASTSRVY